MLNSMRVIEDKSAQKSYRNQMIFSHRMQDVISGRD